MRGDTLLCELHDVLQALTGASTEVHAFSLPGNGHRAPPHGNQVPGPDERGVRLADVASEGTRLHYECVGDECWRYRLDVEMVRPVEPDVGYPVCVAGRQPCPGAPAPDGFDLGRINQRLAALQCAPRAREPAIAECHRARELLAAILRRLPADASDLRAHLAALSPRAVRTELVAMIDRQPDSFAARLLVVDVFSEIGLGNLVPALSELATDSTRPIASRGLAFEVLSLMEPTATASVLGVLPAAERELLLEEQFGNLLVATQVEPDAASLVARTLADQVALGDHEFLGFLEGCRNLVGVPAAVVYAEALHSPALTPIRARLLEILVSAGGSQVAALLMRARDDTADPTWRKRLQRALLSVLTDTVDGPRRVPAVGGRAWLGDLEGSGRFVVFAHIEAPRASCFTGVAASFDGGFCDAELIPRASRQDARRRLSTFIASTGTRLRHVPLEDAAVRVALVARRARERGLEVPPAVAAAVELIESAWSGALEPPARAARRKRF